MNKVLYFLKKNAPVVLTGASIICSAGACVLSAVGAVKSERLFESEKPKAKREKALIYIRSYWPAGLLFSAGAASSIFSHAITAKQIAGLTAACITVENRFRKYRKAISEKLGEEEEKIIYKAAIVESDWSDHPPLPSKLGDSDTAIFYDGFSEKGRYFESTTERVNHAMYHFNRSFVKRGWAILNELYQMLGIPETKEGEFIGWSDADFLENYGMVPWIDFFTDIHEEDDGTIFYSIYSDIPPTRLALEKVFGPNIF